MAAVPRSVGQSWQKASGMNLDGAHARLEAARRCPRPEGVHRALREANVLSDDEHAAIADLLPDLQDDPMTDGWQAAGWLASFAEPPGAEDIETLDLKTVFIVRRPVD